MGQSISNNINEEYGNKYDSIKSGMNENSLSYGNFCCYNDGVDVPFESKICNKSLNFTNCCKSSNIVICESFASCEEAMKSAAKYKNRNNYHAAIETYKKALELCSPDSTFDYDIFPMSNLSGNSNTPLLTYSYSQSPKRQTKLENNPFEVNYSSDQFLKLVSLGPVTSKIGKSYVGDSSYINLENGLELSSNIEMSTAINSGDSSRLQSLNSSEPQSSHDYYTTSGFTSEDDTACSNKNFQRQLFTPLPKETVTIATCPPNKKPPIPISINVDKNADNIKLAQICGEIAYLYFSLRECQESLIWYGRAHFLDPLEVNYIYRKGVVYQFMSNLVEAQNCFKEALKVSPKFTPAIFNSAVVSLNKTETSQAIVHLNTLIELEPENTEAMSLMAQCYEALGKKSEAVTYLNKVLELDPKNFGVKRILENLNSKISTK